MPAVLLPKIIETKFEDLARQVRRLRLYRGVSRAVLVGLMLAAVAIVLDVRFQFSTPLRYGLLGGWFALMALATWRLILRPVREPLSTTTLAAAIETEFPSLSERLMTVVELSESTDAGHGSKSLIDLLVRDTTNRTRKLRVDRAAPRGPVFRIAAVAVAVAIIGLALMFFAGGLDSAKRFLLPWHTPKVEIPFIVKVSSGSPVVKRGEAVTLTGFLERKTAEAVLPTTATLATKDTAGVVKNYPMTGDATNAAFHVSRPTVGNSFDYRIEAGLGVSEWYTVTVADPVDLADGTQMTLTPPDYAAPPLAVQSQKGYGELETLQHSQITFDFKFNRPAVAATLEWVATGAAPVVERERVTLRIETDRLTANATAPLVNSGSYRLVLTGEHGLTTTATISARTILDAPPKFDKAVGISDRAKEIRPDDKIILETAVSDDFKITALELEYTVNDGPPVIVPMAAKDLGTARVESKFVFDLNGKVKEGETLKYRLKATDNRKVATANLAPQVTYFPEKTWSSVKISHGAESLDKQEILGQRNAIKAKLDEAAKAVTEAHREAEKVKRDTAEKPLTPEQKARLETAREELGKAIDALDAVAKEAGLSPELRALAEGAKDAANDTVKPADETIKKAEHAADAKARDRELKKAGEKLTEAAEQVAKLQKLNDDLARNRLDKRRLEKLSDEVNRLSDELKKPDFAAGRDDVLKKLQQAKDELRDVIQGNETLRTAAEKANGAEANKLAKDADKLAAEQKKLDAQIAANETDARKKALDGNAKAQDELNNQADALRDATAKAKPGDATAKEPFDKAAEKLKEGNAVAAMTAQEKAARELDKLAADLKKAAGERSDPKNAAKELAKLQDELQKRRADAAKQPLTAQQKQNFDKEQDALAKAAEKLSTPPGDGSTAEEKAEAVDKMNQAKGAANPEQAQKEAAEALNRLAEKMPTREERLKQTAIELDKLQKEQDALQREIEEAGKGSDRRKPDEALQKELAGKMAGAAKKQAEIGEKLSKLDTPGLENRKQRTADAAKNAGEDLEKGLPQDIPASQAELKKKLHQLRTAVDGGVPNDVAADELAKQQNRLADRLEKQAPDAAALQEMNKLQREFADKLGTMKEPDGAERLNRAKQSAEAAAEQFKKADDIDELRKKTRQAAKDLDDLADHLAGAESDAQRAERLAQASRERAEWSKQNAGKPVPADKAAAMQSELERESDDLKKTRAGAAQAEKKAAADALEKLKKTPNAERAPGLQNDAAEALDKLAKKMQPGEPMAKQPRDTGEKDPVGDAGGKLPTQEQADAAKDLAAKQRELRDQTAKANADAAKNADPKAGDAQAKKQDDLAKDADKLAKSLDQASNAPGNTPDTVDTKALNEAADAAKTAQEKMEKAAREQKAGHGQSAAEARNDAAKALEQSARKAGEAVKGNGKKGEPGGPPDPNAVAASESADAANQMLKDAGPGVGKKDPRAADQLKQAAEKIGDAADKLGEVGKNPKPDAKPGKNPGGDVPGGNDGGKGKALTAEDLPADLKQYAGKLWGDLPGDVKSKIVQDMKAKYGEDYARVIKLYFEQQAEKK